MNETSKCYNLRVARGDFSDYLKGNVIDIGCGTDPLHVLIGTVRRWDVGDGDAQKMAGIADASYDCVYSSHCLEHIDNFNEALENWCRITKPGGYLYIVVPDFDLYELGVWPSQRNYDHKHTFSLTRSDDIKHEGHIHIPTTMVIAMGRLGCEMVRLELEDNGYDYNIKNKDQTLGPALAQICTIWRKR